MCDAEMYLLFCWFTNVRTRKLFFWAVRVQFSTVVVSLICRYWRGILPLAFLKSNIIWHILGIDSAKLSRTACWSERQHHPPKVVQNNNFNTFRKGEHCVIPHNLRKRRRGFDIDFKRGELAKIQIKGGDLKFKGGGSWTLLGIRYKTRNYWSKTPDIFPNCLERFWLKTCCLFILMNKLKIFKDFWRYLHRFTIFQTESSLTVFTRYSKAL